MAEGFVFWAGMGWWAATMLVHWISAGLGRWKRPPAMLRHQPADFSIVAPMVGEADASEAYVRCLADLAGRGAEVLICVTSEADPAIRRTRSHWPQAPILIGSDDTFNPKLNNVRKGLDAASRPVVALCDAGISLGGAELAGAAAPLAGEVGLVLALKAGASPANFAAELECAYINGHQARFLKAADRLGMPVASGGVTILSRDVLGRIGGHQGFLNYLADDYSVVRTVREVTGRSTRLADVMPRLPVGRRRLADVWRRQVRWGSTRLNLSPEVRGLVVLEPAIGWLISGLAAVAAASSAGLPGAWLPIVVILHSAVWLAGEGWFLAAYQLPFGPRAWLAALAREALVPLLAIQAWRGRHRIDWRGTDLAAGWQPARDGGPRANV
ncbi:MAG: glycosyltransferase [Pseudomonadota bacterium]